MSLTANISKRDPEPKMSRVSPILKWDKTSNEQIDEYTRRLHSNIEVSPSASISCLNVCRCRDAVCQAAIQKEYDFLTRCLKDADASLPRFRPGVEKDWWTENLSELRKKSIEIQNLWVRQGRPRQGPTQAERLRARAAYKRAIRAAQRAPKQAIWDRLHTTLSENDSNTFWKSWKKIYNKNKSHLAPVVDGCSSHENIADAFKESFRKNSTPNNTDSVKSLDKKCSDMYADYVAKHNESCDCKPIYITLLNVSDALFSMKKGKCADEELISAEHLRNAPLNFVIRLTDLFNEMLKHAFVPRQFQFGFMLPIVKDQHGNQADLNNYRGITISPITSKLFEHVLKEVI